MCGVKVSEWKITNELTKRLGLEEIVVEVVKRSGLRWMGHVLGRENNEPVKRARDLELDGIRRRRKTRGFMKRNEEDAPDKKKWRVGKNNNSILSENVFNSI